MTAPDRAGLPADGPRADGTRSGRTPAASPRSGGTPAAGPRADGAAGLGRARLAFRTWRRTRPFWGGLLVAIGGGEILSTTVLSLGPTLRVGLGGVNGFVGTLIAAVLTLCGLLLWFSPAQRVFYSVVAILLALATFNTINYGGFFAGMLLGLVGGAMAFAWSQAPGRPRPRGNPAADRGPARPHRGDRALGVATVPMAMSLLLTPGLHAQQTVHSPQAVNGAGHPQACILIILCPPPAPTPRPSGPSSPGPGTSPATPAPGSSQAPGISRPGAPTTAAGQARPKTKRVQAPRSLVASPVPAVLTAGSARLVGLAYDGVAEVPRSSGGPLAMMKFTLQSVTLTGSPTLTIHQSGSVATTSTTSLSFSGDVVLYATRLSGDLLGVPLTITPSSPLSVVLRLLSPLTQGLTVTMTHVVTEQPVTTSAASRWANFLISVRTAA